MMRIIRGSDIYPIERPKYFSYLYIWFNEWNNKGSCWVFSAVGAVDHDGEPVDCSNTGDCLKGGDPRAALQYIVKNGVTQVTKPRSWPAGRWQGSRRSWSRLPTPRPPCCSKSSNSPSPWESTPVPTCSTTKRYYTYICAWNIILYWCKLINTT